MWTLIHTLVVMGQLQENYIGTYESKEQCRQVATELYDALPDDERRKMQSFECVKNGENI